MRVSVSVKGSGLASVQLRLTELSGRQANGTGPSAEVVVTGNSNRALGLFTDAPKGG
jgi:hypothetical protein